MTAIATILGLVLIVGLGLVGLGTVLSLVFARWRERKAREAHAHAQNIGAQPVSLHPRVDLDKCIGSGNCVEVCPEKDVLALVDGKAVIANPSACIGHGECLRACPVDAITLVLGTEVRGVEIPLVSKEFQTNVPGLYVVGELGGMGLVYNAMTQAVQAMTAIGKSLPPKVPGVHQVVIVGAGPAGIAASLKAKQLGLDFQTLDQETLGGTVLHYPRHKIVMTRPVDLPLYGKLRVTEVRKEALLAKWKDIVAKAQLTIRTETRVEKVERAADGVFDVTTSAGVLRAQRVVLAMGRRGTPRKLGVGGEDLGKVTYRLLEPERYVGSRCVVVGGGDAAVEAAIALGKAGAVVKLAHRGKVFDRIKRKNQEYLDQAVARKQVELVLGSALHEIGEREVILNIDGVKMAVLNDYVLIFAGGLLPTKFLQDAGVDVKTFAGEAYEPANE